MHSCAMPCVKNENWKQLLSGGVLLSRCSRQRERLSASELSICLFVCPSVCRQNEKTRFSQKLSNIELQCLLTTYRNLIWVFQRTHHETPKIQDGGDPPSWILTPKCRNAIFSKTKQFRATVSLTTYRNRIWAFQGTHHETPKIQDGGSPPSWILMPKCKMRFSQKLSNLELWSLSTTYRMLCKLNWAFQRTHYWISTV